MGELVCPTCGKDDFKNHHYLGLHVAQKRDDPHTYDGDRSDNSQGSSSESEETRPELSESFEESFDTTVEVDGDSEESDYVELDPSDPVDARLIEQGYSEIDKKAAEKAGEIRKEHLR